MGRPKKIVVKEQAEKKSALETVSPEVEVNPSDLGEIKKVCKEIDMGLKDYLMAIKEGLKAVKIRPATQWDDGGEEPDTEKRLKSALMGLEAEGYIKNKAIANDNSKHTHVTYSWQPVQVINPMVVDA